MIRSFAGGTQADVAENTGLVIDQIFLLELEVYMIKTVSLWDGVEGKGGNYYLRCIYSE